MTSYIGTRFSRRGVTVSIRSGETVKPLPMRYDLRNHSPSGPEWGYQGSGPAQLALALLAHATRDDVIAQLLYQKFKQEVVSRLEQTAWSLTRKQICEWVANEAIRRIAEDVIQEQLPPDRN